MIKTNGEKSHAHTSEESGLLKFPYCPKQSTDSVLFLSNCQRENDPRWPIANIPGLQLSGKARRTRGRHTFRQILVAYGAEEPPVQDTHGWPAWPARLLWPAQQFRRNLCAAALGAE